MMRRRSQGAWMDWVIWLLFAIVALLVGLVFLSVWLEGRQSDLHVTRTESPRKLELHNNHDVRLVQNLAGEPHHH